MIKYDYHTHTSHSSDCSTPMEDMIRQAASLGLEEIAITDHMDFSYPENKMLSPLFGIAANIREINQMRERYTDDICVLIGAEINLRPDSKNVISEIVNTHNFDIIIGSVHEIGAVDFSNEKFYENRTKYEAYSLYLQTVFEAITACSDWDILGHLCYIERYGNYDDKSLRHADLSDIIDEILKRVIHSGKGIEINTSSYHYGLGCPHPAPDIIARYIELGGEIFTIGSDAHRTESIDLGYSETYALLHNLGIKYISRFRNRVPEFVNV